MFSGVWGYYSGVQGSGGDVLVLVSFLMSDSEFGGWGVLPGSGNSTFQNLGNASFQNLCRSNGSVRELSDDMLDSWPMGPGPTA